MGIAALILGIIGALSGIVPFLFWVAGILGVIGLVLGFVGISRAQRGEATNGTMALWGTIISAVAMAVSIVGLVIFAGVFAAVSEGSSTEADSTASPATVTSTAAQAEVTAPTAAETPAPAQAEETASTVAEEVDVYKLEVGDCLGDVPEEGEFSTVPTVPCSEPHSEEVYAALTLPDEDGDFPGIETTEAQADELCFAEFADFVGISYEESVLDFTYFYPTEETWRDGDRLVTCTIYDPGKEVTGSLRGAKR
jgi:hypothetical protein